MTQITAKKLKTLLKHANETTTEMQSLAGELGEAVMKACEDENLHRKAFSTLRMMDRMTPEKLADYWEALKHYVEISGLQQRADSAPRLEFTGEADGDNVKAFPAHAG